jgi:SAM-dependent methyltransferase
LARLGATMTGLDFSPAALAEARALAAGAGVDITYVQSDVYQAPQALAHSAFDLVYTGIGALCWLPDIRRWAEVVDALLAPGGRLFVREGHPMLCALDEHEGGYLKVANPYFETVDPYVDDSDRTYVETEVRFEHTRSLSWNHGLGEVVTALLGRGLVITGLVEHDSVPWEALPGLMTRDGAGEWRLASNPERLAASYTLQAVKPTCGP